MSGKISGIIVGTLLIITVLYMHGCAGRSKSARFYVLTPEAVSSGENAEGRPGINPDAIINILPVSVPKYLKQSRIVTRSSDNELQLAEYDRWAGKIEEDIGRVIAENLSILLGTDRVLSSTNLVPVAADFQVKIDIIQFDGKPGGDLELSARWSIVDHQENVVYGLKATHISETADGIGYNDMVAAQSRALHRFSRELAAAIKKLSVK